MKNKEEIIFHSINGLIMVTLAAIFIIPFWLIISGAFTSEAYLQANGISFFIHGFNFSGFKFLFAANDKFVRAIVFTLGISFFTAFLVVLTAGMCAYALSKKYLVGRKVFNWLIWATGVFNGGMIPTYLLFRALGWYDTVWVLILPMIANSYNILLLRNYFYGLPVSLEEAAALDGANDWQIMTKVFMPLSYPMLFTIGLMTFVGRWNGWMDSLLYARPNHESLWTLQYLLQKVLSNSSALFGGDPNAPLQQLENVAVVVAAMPLVCLSPLLQKYFQRGLTAGSVKG